MQRMRYYPSSIAKVAFGSALIFGGATSTFAAEVGQQALVRDALSAAPSSVAATATVMTMEGKILKQGSGGYTCFPTPADMLAKDKHMPMCLDKVWMRWADAWMHKKPFDAERAGIAYMLAGDAGASNTDPFAAAPTSDNQWVVSGPHIMVLPADPSSLEGIPTDPESGGAFVMWKGTPYAHVMVPVGQPAAATREGKLVPQ